MGILEAPLERGEREREKWVPRMPRHPTGAGGARAALGFGREALAHLLNVLGVLEGSVAPAFWELHWRSGNPLV